MSKRTSSSRRSRIPLPKVMIGIKGVDDVLRGGLPEGRTTVIIGAPGTGKSVFGLEFLYHGALSGEPGIWVSCEQPAEELRRDARSLGIDLARLEKENKFSILPARLRPGGLVIGDFGFEALLSRIVAERERLGARRIVIDELDALLRVYHDPERECREFHGIHEALRETGVTVLFTGKPPGRSSRDLLLEFMTASADCLLELSQRVEAQITTRRLRVLKYRGSSFASNEFPFVISEDGIRVIPVAQTSLDYKPPGKRLSTGCQSLDGVLGGGIAKTSIVLIAGEPGTGKTTLASLFARTACERGENVLYETFEESLKALIGNMLSAGVDLRAALKAGKLRCDACMPESMGFEQHLARKLEIIERFRPAHIIVDAMSSFLRMGSPQAAHDYLIRLVHICRQGGITGIFLNETDGELTAAGLTGNSISSVVDTALLLRYLERDGEVCRVLRVVRSRGTRHSTSWHRLVITREGIQILPFHSMTSSQQQEVET